MKIQWKKLIICILIPLAVGGASAFLTRDGIQVFEWINKPALSPPAWLFPVAWTILYVLMGISSYLVLVNEKNRGPALTVYGIQLFFNFVWPIIFFNMEAYLLAFIWLAAMWILIIVTTIQFKKVSKAAALLLIPYILWVAFAGYLNFGIYLLN